MLEYVVKLRVIILDNHQKIFSGSFATHSPQSSGEYLPVGFVGFFFPIYFLPKSSPMILSCSLFI